MDNLAILIPAYNEEKTIFKVINDVFTATIGIPNVSVYVYDNNSTDRTVELARTTSAIVRHEQIQGKGATIRRMFREVDAKAYVIIDADDTYPAENIPEMYHQILKQKVDMVIGDRLSSTYFSENKRTFHNFGNGLVRFLINFLFKSDIKDILTGFRAFSYRFVKTLPVLSNGFEVETEMTIHAIESNMTIENQVVIYRDRPDGSYSKLKTYNDGFRVIATIINLYRIYHPLAFFGIISMIVLMLAIIPFIFRVLFPYLHTGIVKNMPTLMVSMILVVVAIVSVFAGLILDAILSHKKCNFEYKLNDTENNFKIKEER